MWFVFRAKPEKRTTGLPFNITEIRQLRHPKIPRVKLLLNLFKQQSYNQICDFFNRNLYICSIFDSTLAL
ncbi:MAG: hypothetical protein U5L45_02630 [Saprospiraceae bacterium]|nr:hypothetical protein [Saprospiraceae bacterium]